METVVFTNGCFDILHPGHINLLNKARSLGTKLIVGINSDNSVRSIKGSPRPFLNQEARAAILSELRSVDEVLVFEENTPEKLIKQVKPNILVKGGDWKIDQIVGADFVLENGGKVFSIPFENDFSSSKIVEKIKAAEVQANNREIIKSENINFTKESLKSRITAFQHLLDENILNLTDCADVIFEKVNSGRKVFFLIDVDDDLNLKALLTIFAEFLKDYAQQFQVIKLISDNQTQSIIENEDLLIIFSREGNSAKIIQAVMNGRQAGGQTIGVIGFKARKLAALCDQTIYIKSESPQVVSEVSEAITNIWAEIIQQKF